LGSGLTAFPWGTKAFTNALSSGPQPLFLFFLRVGDIDPRPLDGRVAKAHCRGTPRMGQCCSHLQKILSAILVRRCCP
jgi:hypothetical protein